MSTSSVTIGTVITVFLVGLQFGGMQSLPINNGFSVKFSPISLKDEVKSKSFGAMFAKIPQELKSPGAREILSKTIFPQAEDLGKGSTNQIAKILFPMNRSYEIHPSYENNDSKTWDTTNFINIPIIKQPVHDYKIIVATAPKNIRLGRGSEEKPVVVYIVFPDDDPGDSKSLNIPNVYFVNKPNGKVPFHKSEKIDPIFIIDSNRTVTGLKSAAVSKFVKFKNKLSNQHDFHVTT